MKESKVFKQFLTEIYNDKQSAAVIAQKLQQKGMKVSQRSVQRVIKEYGP